MEFGKTVFLFLSVLGVAWWIGVVWKAEGEDKYVQACTPVTVSTKYLMKIANGLTGFTPNWTVKTKQVLDGGCYYFFATFLFSDSLGEGTEAAVRQKSRKGAGSREVGGVRQQKPKSYGGGL